MLNSALRRTLSDASIVDIVRNQPRRADGRHPRQVKNGAERFGINIVDVRIKRADLPPENSDAVFRRMQAERQRLAATFRAEGVAAESEDQSRRRRHGDGASPRRSSSPSRFAAKATPTQPDLRPGLRADPEFFAFYRSMQAYDAAFKGDTRAILSPKSDFFRYFKPARPPPRRDARRPISCAAAAAAAPLPLCRHDCRSGSVRRGKPGL